MFRNQAARWLAPTLLLACSGPRPRLIDAGTNGGRGGDNQGGTGGGSDGVGGGNGGMGGGPATCLPGAPYCAGQEVRMCDAMGLPGDLIASCPDACSAGRCTTAPCAEAEKRQSVVGCLFYAVDTDNAAKDDTQIYGFPVGNGGTVPAAVTIARATGPGTWAEMLKATVAPGLVSYLRIARGPHDGLDHHVEGTGKEWKGYRITSDGPIVAYQINSDDEDAYASNSGSTLLLPIHALGRHHFALTPPDRGTPRPVPAPSGFGPDHAFIDVVGVRDGTKVTIAVAGNTEAGGSVAVMKKGETREFMLGEGEVLQIQTAGLGDDLSGSEITSDKPVAVFSGNVCGSLGADRSAMALSCDHVEEQLYPVNTWGRSFVVLDMRMGNFNPSNQIWVQVVASEDATALMFEAPRALAGMPTTATLNKGQSLFLTIDDPWSYTDPKRAHFRLESTKPVSVQSLMGQEEGGALMLPVDQFLDEYLISAHPWFTGHLMVTRTAGTPVMLDGAAMSADLFTPAGGGFEVSFVALERCETDLTKCGHKVAGAKVGVTLTANGGSCNYCYAGGAGARCVNKSTVECR